MTAIPPEMLALFPGFDPETTTLAEMQAYADEQDLMVAERIELDRRRRDALEAITFS